MTQKDIANLFSVDVSTINYHLKLIYKSEELSPNSNHWNFSNSSKTKLNKKTARTLLPTEYGRAGYYQYHGDIIHRLTG